MSFHSYSTAENQRLKRTERPDRFHSPRRTVAVEVGSQVYGTHHTARQYAHSQVFTESYKKYLGRSRPAARSWNFYCCECAVSLARSRSTPRFSASFSRPRFSSPSARDYSPSPSPPPALCSSFLLRALFLSRSVHETDLYLFLFGRQGNDKATHVLIVADPQILDERSYPQRSSLLRTVSRIFVDMNLRKAWRVAKSTHPHAVIFLGDLMDNGFADMHIAQYVCPSSPPPPLFFFFCPILEFRFLPLPSHSLLLWVIDTRSMPHASTRYSSLLRRFRCTICQGTTTWAWRMVAIHHPSRGHATGRRLARSLNTWYLGDTRFSWSMHLGS